MVRQLSRSFSDGDQCDINQRDVCQRSEPLRNSSYSSRDGKLFEIRRHVRMDSCTTGGLATYRRWASQCDTIGDVVAFVNSESGSGVGQAIVQEFIALGCEVCDLANPTEPRLLLSTLRNAPRKRFLVCGGDGTVTWILQELERAGVEGPAAIVPLGTGNDLSRSLGWGPHLEHISDLSRYLRWVAVADEVPLDTWRITVTTEEDLPADHTFYNVGSHPRPVEGAPHTFVGYFQNYFSIGLDARITYFVEESRKAGRCGRVLFRRGLGKCVYAWNGAKESLFKGFCDKLLTPYLRLEDPPTSLEDRKIHSCLLRGRCRQISIININSYAGGQKVYHGIQQPSDGLLEVLAVRNACCVLGIFGRCNGMHYIDSLPNLTLRLTSATYMQIDGESWYMPSPCTVSIERHKTVAMLRAPEDAFWTSTHPADFWTSPHPHNYEGASEMAELGVL